MNDEKKKDPGAFALGCAVLAVAFGVFAPLVIVLWKWALR